MKTEKELRTGLFEVGIPVGLVPEGIEVGKTIEDIVPVEVRGDTFVAADVVFAALGAMVESTVPGTDVAAVADASEVLHVRGKRVSDPLPPESLFSEG